MGSEQGDQSPNPLSHPLAFPHGDFPKQSAAVRGRIPEEVECRKEKQLMGIEGLGRAHITRAILDRLVLLDVHDKGAQARDVGLFFVSYHQRDGALHTEFDEAHLLRQNERHLTGSLRVLEARQVDRRYARDLDEVLHRLRTDVDPAVVCWQQLAHLLHYLGAWAVEVPPKLLYQ